MLLKNIVIINIKPPQQNAHVHNNMTKIEGNFQRQDNNSEQSLHTETLNPYLFVTLVLSRIDQKFDLTSGGGYQLPS